MQLRRAIAGIVVIVAICSINLIGVYAEDAIEVEQQVIETTENKAKETTITDVETTIEVQDTTEDSKDVESTVTTITESTDTTETSSATDSNIEEPSVELRGEEISVGEWTSIIVYYKNYSEKEHIKVEYKSSDDSIATIDDVGTITGIKTGSVDITVVVTYYYDADMTDQIKQFIVEKQLKVIAESKVSNTENSASATTASSSNTTVSGETCKSSTTTTTKVSTTATSVIATTKTSTTSKTTPTQATNNITNDKGASPKTGDAIGIISAVAMVGAGIMFITHKRKE